MTEDCTGLCAERIREMDWSGSSLGNPQEWPTGLGFVLGMILRSSAPKLLLWGDDLVTFYNDAGMRIFRGLGLDGIGQGFAQVCPQVWEHIAGSVQMVKGGGAWVKSGLELPSRSGQGDRPHYQLYYTSVPGDQCNPQGVLIDIYNATPFRELAQSLRDETNWLNRLFTEAPVFIAYLSGPNFVVEFTNHEFDRLFNYRRLIGLPLANAISETEAQGFTNVLCDVFTSGRPFIGSNLEIVHGNGESGSTIPRYIDFIYQPVLDDNGQVSGILCTGTDVTDRHGAQREAERLKHQVLHASRINAMGTMAMTVAHELNQPLAAAANLIGAAQQLLTSPQGDPAQVLKDAEAELLRAGDVIRRIRSLVKSGRVERTPVSVQRAHDRAVMLLKAAGTENIETIVTLDPDATRVMADEIQLEQIFTNLLNNALHATADAEHKGIHVTSSVVSGGQVQLTIRDFGPGLPEERVHNVFDGLGMTAGTGLGFGLALTRTLVEANNGTIRSSNAPDGGAVFEILLDLPA